MEEIKQIISKVREMYRFDTTVKDIVASPVSVRISEVNGELKISGIIFNYYTKGDNVTVVSDEIRYYDSKENEWHTLITYENFNGLLNM